MHILENSVLPSLEKFGEGLFCIIQKCFSKSGVFTQKETVREDQLPCNGFCWSTYFWLYTFAYFVTASLTEQ